MKIGTFHQPKWAFNQPPWQYKGNILEYIGIYWLTNKMINYNYITIYLIIYIYDWPSCVIIAMARGYNGYNLCKIYNGILGYINAVDITCTQTAWAPSWRIFFHHQLGRSGHFWGGVHRTDVRKCKKLTV
jgi:hypothetical protein